MCLDLLYKTHYVVVKTVGIGTRLDRQMEQTNVNVETLFMTGQALKIREKRVGNSINAIDPTNWLYIQEKIKLDCSHTH